ncbi:glycosyltransferase family 4 protein [Rhodococcus sp. 2H158]
MTGPKVRIAILGINFAPEPTGIAPYTTLLASGLAARGHEVEVLTGFPHYPQWKRLDGGFRFRSDEIEDRVRIRRFGHHVPQGATAAGRALMEMSFGLQLLLARWNGPDVVLCVSPPLLAAGLSVVRARLSWRRPAIGVIVHDLYSRGVVEAAALSGLSACVAQAVESAFLRSADGIVVIHEGFAQILEEHLGVDRRRIRTIRNWNHVAPPDPAASSAFRAAHGWDSDEVVILHAGNMGTKQGLENVVAAARLASREGRRVRFVLLGDGNQRVRLEAAGAGIPTLQFLAPVTDENFPSALGAADVLLVNERPGVAQMAVPSKLTSYFNSGKPVLAATDADGFTATEIAASGAGIRVPADRPDLLLREAVRLGTDGALAAHMGEQGRRYCATTLSTYEALERYEEWIRDLVRESRRQRSR